MEESHPSIIGKEIWEAVQLEKERRKAFAEKHQIRKIDYSSVDHPFAGRVICGHCGKVYGRKVWKSSDENLRRIVWRCNSKYQTKGQLGCESRHIDDKLLYLAFVNTFNAIVENIDYFMNNWTEKIKSENVLERVTVKRFISIFQATDFIEKFDLALYFKLIEKITVHDDEKLVVSLLDGTEIECEIE